MAMLVTLLLSVLFTSSITAIFGWTVVVAWRTGTFYGIGWSASRSGRPVAFWFNTSLAMVAGTISLAFFILVVWVTEQKLAS